MSSLEVYLLFLRRGDLFIRLWVYGGLATGTSWGYGNGNDIGGTKLGTEGLPITDADTGRKPPPRFNNAPSQVCTLWNDTEFEYEFEFGTDIGIG